MKHIPLTRQQSKTQIISSAIQCVVGLMWFFSGFLSHDPIYWGLGLLFLVLHGGNILYILWVRKHFPIEDPEKDRQLREDVKTSTHGLLIFSGFITAAFLVAFLLVLLLR